MYKKAAIVGAITGAVMSLINIIPFVNCLNCILIFVPGVLAVYLAKQDGEIITMGNGAGAGATSGACSSVASAIVGIPLLLIMGSAQIQEALQQAGAGSAALSGGMFIVVLLIGYGVLTIIAAIINSLTGLITTAILNR